jgi:3,4-dihydroxy 2-butanone 4-phosphate synthase/GTP cyclohydrolase II
VPYTSVERAIEAIAAGRTVVVVDDAQRENEGDLVLAAEAATPETVAFFLRHTSGVLCVALPGARCDALQLPPMVARGEESQGTAFTVSVDARRGITTGISASDRAATIRILAGGDSRADDLVRPGHVFPLRAREGGVLRRRGHTEASCDLAQLAGRSPAAVLGEIMHDDGSMMRPPALEAFARDHALPLISIDDLVAYRRRTEPIVEKVSEARLPTRHGAFTVAVFRDVIEGREHVALVRGEVKGQENVLVRVHSECLTGDLFGSRRCDCGEQLECAMARVAQAGQGVVVYLRGHEGRGVGLINKLHAYRLQDQGRDTVEANLDLGLPVDSRRYDVGAQILVAMGLTTIRLMSNNPAKFAALEGYPLRIVERVPLIAETNPENAAYLLTKQHKLGHLLGLAAGVTTAVALQSMPSNIHRGCA